MQSHASVIIPLKRINTPTDPIRERRSPRKRPESSHAVIGSDRESVYALPRVIFSMPFVKREKGSIVVKTERIITHIIIITNLE